MSPTDIAVEVEEDIDNIRHTLRRMDKDGQVKKVGHGKYCHSSHSVNFEEVAQAQNDTMTEMTINGRGVSGPNDLWHERVPELEEEL
jgi:hypothetical protein